MAIVDFARFAAAERDRPDSLGRTRRIARRIRRLPSRILLSAARIDDRVAVFRKSDLAQLLSIVLQVGSQASRFEIWGFRHPNVPLALIVERPCNAIRFFRRDEIGRERRREYLLEREALSRLRLRLSVSGIRNHRLNNEENGAREDALRMICHSNL